MTMQNKDDSDNFSAKKLDARGQREPIERKRRCVSLWGEKARHYAMALASCRRAFAFDGGAVNIKVKPRVRRDCCSIHPSSFLIRCEFASEVFLLSHTLQR